MTRIFQELEHHTGRASRRHKDTVGPNLYDPPRVWQGPGHRSREARENKTDTENGRSVRHVAQGAETSSGGR